MSLWFLWFIMPLISSINWLVQLRWLPFIIITHSLLVSLLPWQPFIDCYPSWSQLLDCDIILCNCFPFWPRLPYKLKFQFKLGFLKINHYGRKMSSYLFLNNWSRTSPNRQFMKFAFIFFKDKLMEHLQHMLVALHLPLHNWYNANKHIDLV